MFRFFLHFNSFLLYFFYYIEFEDFFYCITLLLFLFLYYCFEIFLSLGYKLNPEQIWVFLFYMDAIPISVTACWESNSNSLKPSRPSEQHHGRHLGAYWESAWFSALSTSVQTLLAAGFCLCPCLSLKYRQLSSSSCYQLLNVTLCWYFFHLYIKLYNCFLI